MRNAWIAPIRPIRSTWNESHLLMRGKLTDRKIEQYAKQGYYSDQFREARHELWMRKAAKRTEKQARRDGNFLLYPDGSKVYSPI